MGRAKCGCQMWETKNGDTEEYLCPRHAGPTLCPLNERENCKRLHIESEDECWCEHPNYDGIDKGRCPIDEEEENEAGQSG